MSGPWAILSPATVVTVIIDKATKAEVLILVSDYLDNRQIPVTTTRINYDLLIEPITTSTYNVTLF